MNKIQVRGGKKTNCYFVICGSNCYIIDPGYEGERIQQYVEDNNLNVLAVLLTHGHSDHAGACAELGYPVYIHEDDCVTMFMESFNGTRLAGMLRYKPDDIDLRTFRHKHLFALGDSYIMAYHTPGHTEGSCIFVYKNDMFSGDTLFFNAVGDTGTPSGSATALAVSIVEILDKFPDKMMVHPGHGWSSTVAYEKEHNKFYKEHKVLRIS